MAQPFQAAAGLTCYFGAGWKAWATDLKDFQGSLHHKRAASTRQWESAAAPLTLPGRDWPGAWGMVPQSAGVAPVRVAALSLSRSFPHEGETSA